MDKTAGQIGYEMWCATLTNGTVLSWDDLSPETKKAWHKIASVIVFDHDGCRI